ncbi:MAG: four helix bundle protein [Muribaculaceae bacterium]|nr:four helix bundle protein [Muribaculaceae bacterium]
MKTSDYKDLKIWIKSMDLAKIIYTLTQRFPKEEIFGLTSQMRRCAVSIPSNIAEGHARNSKKDFIHFLKISLGSNAELETQAILSQNFDYITIDELSQIQKETKEISKMIISLIHHLQQL